MRARAIAVVLAAFAAAAQPAAAGQRTLRLLSDGLSAIDTELDAEALGVSDDGSIAFFQTEEALAASDTDAMVDVYGRTAAGALIHVSDGPAPDRAADAHFRGASADGTHVYFETVENLLESDTDALTPDLYERTPAGTLVHVSDNPIYPDTSGFEARFAGRSDDGSRVYFETGEELAETDTDWAVDVYERGPGGLRHISDSSLSDDTEGAELAHVSGDGARVYFATDERLTLTDDDTVSDVYLRTATSLIHLTDDPTGPEAGHPAELAGETPDGSRAWFHTREPMAPTDTDDAVDTYERTAAGALTHVTRDPAGPEADLDARVSGMSEDGDRLVFETREAMAAGDGDTTRDVYLRTRTGELIHVSDTRAGTDEDMSAFYAGMSADGSRVLVNTGERLTASDTDAAADLYEHVPGGALVHVSDGPAGPDAEITVTGSFISSDGARVLFGTGESLAATDTDTAPDAYEHGAGGLHHLTDDPAGRDGEYAAYLAGATPDGRRVQFETGESLAAADGDGAVDVYLATALPDPPAPAQPPAGGASAPRDTTAPRLTGLRFAAGRSAIRFRLSEPATVRVRLVRGRRTHRSFAVSGKPGFNRVRLRRPAPGRYRLTATPRDRAGNRGTPRRTTFRVR